MRSINKHTRVLLVASALTLVSLSTYADDKENEPEPCINGGVSATGIHETQALEDAASNKNVAVKRDIPGSDFRRPTDVSK